MGEKSAVLKLLEQLPEETTLEEIQYHLYVLKKNQGGSKCCRCRAGDPTLGCHA